MAAKTPDPKDQAAGNQYSQAYLDHLRGQGKIHGVLPLDLIGRADEGPLEVLAGRYSLSRLVLLRTRPGRADTWAGEYELLTLMDSA